MDYNNVTFRQLFITGFFLIAPITLWSTVRIMEGYSKRNDILSLFLMGIYALIYVVLLYLALVKTSSGEGTEGKSLFGNMQKTWSNKKKTVIASIYVVRYAIRLTFFLYLFTLGCQTLMLPEYSKVIIAVPILLALFYMAGKGLRGYIGFGEAGFAGLVFCIAIFVICSFGNAEFSRLSEYASFGKDSSISYTICSVMSKGYLLVTGLCMLEFILFLYLKVKRRKRGMLVWTVSVPVVFSVIASCFVVALLGGKFGVSGKKELLNVVGAMKLPGGANARIGLLACYMFVLSGIMLMAVHALFICRFLLEEWQMFRFALPGKSGEVAEPKKEQADKKKQENRKEQKEWSGQKAQAVQQNQTASLWIRGIVCLGIFVLFLIACKIFEHYNAERIFMTYLAAIDIPLSVLVPAFACRKKTNPGKMAKMAAEIIGAFLVVILVTGCSDKSIEAVDYLRVIIVRESEGAYSFDFVTDSLESAQSANESEEKVYTVLADNLNQACKKYDVAHDRALDLSHVEYVVVSSVDVLEQLYPELMDQFVTNYVEVICTKKLYQGKESGSIREYIASHYKGKCLAAIEF